MAKEKENLRGDALDETLKQIEKLYGKGAVMRLGDRETVDVDAIPSGSLLIDEAIGVGGYPKGRIIEIFGPESSGKTTLALHAIAECQKNGGRAAFIDAEHAIDPLYAKNLGVDINELIAPLSSVFIMLCPSSKLPSEKLESSSSSVSSLGNNAKKAIEISLISLSVISTEMFLPKSIIAVCT